MSSFLRRPRPCCARARVRRHRPWCPPDTSPTNSRSGGSGDSGRIQPFGVTLPASVRRMRTRELPTRSASVPLHRANFAPKGRSRAPSCCAEALARRKRGRDRPRGRAACSGRGRISALGRKSSVCSTIPTEGLPRSSRLGERVENTHSWEDYGGSVLSTIRDRLAQAT
jgi:hypothetical protein